MKKLLFLLLVPLLAHGALSPNDYLLVLGGSGASPAPWSPTNTSVSGPALAWWEVEGNYTTNSGNAQLPDLTGNGYLIRAAAASAPPRTADILGSFDALYFNSAVTSYLTNGPITANHPVDVFLVMSLTNSGSYIFSDTNTSFEGLFIDGASHILANAGANIQGNATFNTYGVLRVRFDSTVTSGIVWNNSQLVTGNAGANNPIGFTLGQRYDRSSGASFSFVAGIVFTNLQSADVEFANYWITNRFGINQGPTCVSYPAYTSIPDASGQLGGTIYSVGFVFTVGATDICVTNLARLSIGTGTSATHSVRIYKYSDSSLVVSGTTPSGAASLSWGTVAVSATLQAGVKYIILSEELEASDQWGAETFQANSSSAITINNACYTTDYVTFNENGGAGHAYQQPGFNQQP